ncbi:MAG: sulfocyanin-like copper-binding protein [Chloroflexota bacterium]
MPLVLLILTIVIAACGGGGEAAEPQEAAGVTLDYTGFDAFSYNLDTATVKAGSEVTINFTNEGALQHNWLLVSERVDPLEATEADALSGATTGELGGGETATITFNAPPAGTYQVVCTVAGHAEGGMVAEFVVEP